ncbi:hypothetical protein BS50DRAFT_666005 [Corynespora cassiicola Philippines]|uniref:Uncharacterized protein n=1 Tax=Corynespora cassiicola Philippines TaxID=1448308 RepID=A0A2T2NSC6_CORCC|nr:hypothetical protein BS50DRAFT_666005 [Corynespora cassiicola Philippines]
MASSSTNKNTSSSPSEAEILNSINEVLIAEGKDPYNAPPVDVQELSKEMDWMINVFMHGLCVPDSPTHQVGRAPPRGMGIHYEWTDEVMDADRPPSAGPADASSSDGTNKNDKQQEAATATAAEDKKKSEGKEKAKGSKKKKGKKARARAKAKAKGKEEEGPGGVRRTDKRPLAKKMKARLVRFCEGK